MSASYQHPLPPGSNTSNKNQKTLLKWLISDPLYGRPPDNSSKSPSRLQKSQGNNENKPSQNKNNFPKRKIVQQTYHVHVNDRVGRHEIDNVHTNEDIHNIKIQKSDQSCNTERLNANDVASAKTSVTHLSSPYASNTVSKVETTKTPKDFIELNRQNVYKMSQCLSKANSRTIQDLSETKSFRRQPEFSELTRQIYKASKSPSKTSSPTISDNTIPESKVLRSPPDFIELNRQQAFRRSKSVSRTLSPTKCEDRSNRPAMNWDDYHRLDVIHDFMDDLESTFPSICTTGCIGKSLEGRDLKILKISNSNAKNKAVWMDAGIHAREWIAPATATFIANQIARNFHKLPEYITNKDWYFLPVMNPDGYEYSHTKDRMWRKNRAWHGGKCLGVDLNRNFSLAWGGKESSDNPMNAFYRGPDPFSEPESTAVRDMLLNSGVSFTVYMSLHSYGQIILFPFAHRDELCPDYIKLLEGATAMSKAIYETSGNTYKVGISRDVMYGAAGTSTDWSYGAAGIPYCYLFELRSKQHKFKVPKEEIQETGQEILNSVYALMNFVDSYKPPKFKKEPMSAINIWNEEHSTMDIMVEGPRVTQVASMLHEREIPYSVAVNNLDVLVQNEQELPTLQPKVTTKDAVASNCGNKQTMNWTSYHRLNVIYSFLDSLEKEFPYLCSVIFIGKSVEGRPIKVLKISNGNEVNCGVWIDAAIHPREWISTAVATYIANHIVRNFHDMPECITNKDWYILPVLNPDGYEYTHKYDRMWRKNRGRYGECVGVDLNRNFSYGWGENGEEGSSEDPGNIFFRGSKPFSEPETAAVKRAIMKLDANFKVYLSFHSYGEVIIFPWGYTGDPCPDYVELLEGGTAMSKAIFECSGRTFKVGSTKDLMYYAAGTSSDWAYAVANIPYSYMVELRSKQHKFLLPREEIESSSIEAYQGVLSLMQFVDKRSKSTQSSRSTCCCSK